MQSNRPMLRICAWVMVVVLVMSAGMSVRAQELLNETEPLTESESREIESETAQEMTKEPETKTETETESSAAGIGTAPETETMTESERQTETDKKSGEKTARKPEGKPRAAGDDRSADFKVDYLRISFYDTVVHEENNGVSNPIDIPPSFASTFMVIKVDFKWSLKNAQQDDFLGGEYLEFEVCRFSAANTSIIWTGYTGEQVLKDRNDGTTVLGTGKFRVINDNGEVKLVYRVTFHNNIKNRFDIGGELNCKANLAETRPGDHVTVKRESEALFNWERKDTADDNGFVGDVKPIEIPPTKKEFYYYNDNGSKIDWILHWTEFAVNRYQDYQDNYTANSYDYIIIEDLLDCYQTFDVGVTANPFGANLTVSGLLPLYDPDELLGSRDKITFYSDVHKYFSLANNSIINRDGTMSPEQAARQVKNTPGTMTVIKETCPDHPDRTRERMIINLGAPGNQGYRFQDFDANTDTFITKLENDILNIRVRIIEPADAANKGEDEIIADWADKHPRKLSEWRNVLKVYKQTLEYYEANPYVYAYRISLKSAFDPLDPEVINLDALRNSSIMTSGVTRREDGAYLENKWSGVMYARARPGEVQIYKADSLGGFTEGSHGAAVTLGDAAVPAVEFRVYRRGDDAALKFQLNPGTGKYEVNSGGSETVITNARGSLVLAGLTPGQKYTIRETAPAQGYYTEAKQIDFTVDSAKAVYKLLNNTPRGVELTKVDRDSRETLANAEFALYRSDGSRMSGFAVKRIGGTEQLVYTGNAADTAALQTDSGGRLKITRLPAGSYYFTEVTAPAGYLKPADRDNRFAFTLPDVKGTETVVRITAENTRDTEEQKPEWYLYKVNAEGEPLAGAQFSLKDEHGSERTLVSGADGRAALALEPGSYTLTEIAAPAGYKLYNAPVSLTVSDGYVLSLTGTVPVNTTLADNGLQIRIVNVPDPTTGKLLEADIEIEKTVDKAKASAKDQLEYSITVRHVGDAVAVNDIVIRDYVPDHTKYVSCSRGGEYGVEDGREYVEWRIASLNQGEERTLQMTVRIDGCTPGTKIRNTALVRSSKDKTLKSNEARTEVVKSGEEVTAGTRTNGSKYVTRKSSRTGSRSGPRTGDASQPLYLYALILSAAVLIYLRKYRIQ